MNFAANLSMLYGHLPLADRFAAAAGDGFGAAEILFPYDESPQWYAAQLRKHGLCLVLVNTPIDPPRYSMGMAAQPEAHALFRDSFETALALCRSTGCHAVHVMPGLIDPGLPVQEQRAVFLDNLQWAAQQDREITLHLEPLNQIDVPAYFYHCPDEAVAILGVLNEPNIGLQFDFYHVVKQGLDLTDELQKNRHWVRHVQVAGSPQRDEPDLELNGLLSGFEELHRTGYPGSVGFEYRPRGSVGAGLEWARPLVDNGWASWV